MTVYLLIMKIITRNSRKEIACLHIPDPTLVLRQAAPSQNALPAVCWANPAHPSRCSWNAGSSKTQLLPPVTSPGRLCLVAPGVGLTTCKPTCVSPQWGGEGAPSQRPGSQAPSPTSAWSTGQRLEGLSCTLWSPQQSLKGMWAWGVPHRSLVGLLVEGLPKDSHNKEVDEEGDRQCDGGFNQEVHVGFSDVCPAGPVYLSRL